MKMVLYNISDKGLCSVKDTVKRMKNKPQPRGKKTYGKCISDKGLLSKI